MITLNRIEWTRGRQHHDIGVMTDEQTKQQNDIWRAVAKKMDAERKRRARKRGSDG